MKGISIITNFGCDCNCWYCIWKNHKLNKVRLEIDYQKLFDFLKANKSLGKVSLSGGGDPLFNFNGNGEFWNWIFKTGELLNIKIDVHTRIKLDDSNFWRSINLCAFSLDNLNNDKQYLEWLAKYTKLRITHVVTKNTSDKMIEDFIGFCDKNDCQLTLKQLSGFDDGGRYAELKSKYPDLFYLDSADYNIYYMPDNTITDKFIN